MRFIVLCLLFLNLKYLSGTNSNYKFLYVRDIPFCTKYKPSGSTAGGASVIPQFSNTLIARFDGDNIRPLKGPFE